MYALSPFTMGSGLCTVNLINVCTSFILLNCELPCANASLDLMCYMSHFQLIPGLVHMKWVDVGWHCRETGCSMRQWRPTILVLVASTGLLTMTYLLHSFHQPILGHILSLEPPRKVSWLDKFTWTNLKPGDLNPDSMLLVSDVVSSLSWLGQSTLISM